MKKSLLVIALMLLSCQSVYAETGNKFVTEWKEYKKSEAGQSYNSFNAAYYMGVR